MAELIAKGKLGIRTSICVPGLGEDGTVDAAAQQATNNASQDNFEKIKQALESILDKLNELEPEIDQNTGDIGDIQDQITGIDISTVPFNVYMDGLDLKKDTATIKVLAVSNIATGVLIDEGTLCPEE